MKLAVLAALALAVCVSVPWTASDAQESSSERASAAATETVLRVGSLERIDCLNPYVGLTDMSHVFYGLVYDSLFSVGNDLETVGNLVTGWWAVPETDPALVVSGEPYGSVWEYNITPSAKWHDGEPFTVEDVVWNINLNADNFDFMWAYQPYSNFMDYAEAVDEDTVRIHYYDRDTEVPIPVAFGDSLYLPMLPMHLLGDWTAAEVGFMWNGLFSEEESPGHPLVGTGPFTVTEYIEDEYVDGDHITLVRNPDYHWAVDKGEEVQFDKMVIYSYDDASDLDYDLRQGSIDVAQLPPEYYESLKEDISSGLVEDLDAYDGLKANQYWTEIGFNMNDGGPNPTRLDPAVRHALAMATNKTYITETNYQGYAEPGSTLVSPVNDEWHYEFDSDGLFPYDLDAAAQVLEDAGYVYTLESPEVRVASASSLAVIWGLVEAGTPLEIDMMVRREHPEEVLTAFYLQDVWAEIGVSLLPRVVDEVTLPTVVYGYEYDTFIWDWSSDPDPNNILYVQSEYAWDGWSDNLYYNESYEWNYRASVSEMDREERKAYVDSCQQVHYNDAAYIVLAYVYQTYAWRTDTFTGWGDWAEDPGRSLDAYWGANPLLFDLEYGADDEVPETQLVPYEREGRFSMLVPDGWGLEEDEVVNGTTYDLIIRGPILDDSQTNIIVEHEDVRGVEETREYLESEMDNMFGEFEAEGISTTMILSPVYWEGANYSALRFAYEWNSTPLVQDVTIYTDSESAKAWMVISSVHSDFYEDYAPVFEEMAESLDVVESDLVPMLEIVGMVVVAALVIAVVAVVAYLVLRKRKEPKTPPPPPTA